MTNETQTIDADALRARLAETPADLRGRTCTAAEAQALLDALMAANDLQCAAGRPCRACDARIDAVRALTDAAPALVATVTAQADEAERLRAALAVTQASLEAASSGRRVTVVDEIERLQRARDEAECERDALYDTAREWVRAEDALTAAIVAADGPDTDGAYAAAVTRRNAAHAALRAATVTT